MSTDSSAFAGDGRVPREALIRAAVFGMVWAFIGLWGLQGAPGLWIWLGVVALALSVAFFAAGVYFIRTARRRPVGTGEQWAERGRVGAWYGLVFGTQGVLIAAVTLVCSRLSQVDLMMPLILIIVGVHFLPLAWLLRMPIHYLTGTLLVGVAVLTLVAVPARSTVAGSHQIATWWFVCGGATSVVLWFVGGWLIVLSIRLVHRAPHAPAQRV